MKISSLTRTEKTPQRSSKIQTQKKKEISAVQILLIIIACLLYVFVQNQEAILKSLAKQRSSLFSESSESGSIQYQQPNIYEVYYKKLDEQSLREENYNSISQKDQFQQARDIKPLFKQLLEKKLEKMMQRTKKVVIETPTERSWKQVNIDDISLHSIKDIIQTNKAKSALKSSQFYTGQMSFIVSLKASANFLQNSLFLEHTMIEQMGKGKQLSRIIDNSFQYMLKNAVGFDGISKFVNSQRTINKQIHGIAALKSASKTIRTQFTVDMIYTLVETTIDLTRFIRGDITGSNFVKNIAFNLISTTGSTVGYMYGTIKFGNQLGGIMGSISGAFSSNFIAQVIYKEFFSDEPQISEQELLIIIKEIIYGECTNTDLNMNEIELLIQKVSSSSFLNIESDFDIEVYQRKLTEHIKTLISEIIENREKIIKA